MIFAIATFAFMPQSLLGQASTGAIDVLEDWSPYEENLDDPPDVANPLQGDQTESIPRIVNFYDGLRDGRVQQWEPNVAGGTPLATMPFDGIWSPLNWSHAALPHWYATSLRAAFSIFIAQVGTFLFLRRLGIGRSAATIGAIGFGFSAATLVFLQRVTVVFVFPLLMHAVERVLQRRSPGTVAWLATTVAWCWIEGFPTGFIYALAAAGAWALLRLGGDLVTHEVDLGESFRRSVSLVAGVIWGLCLSAFALVPFLAQLSKSGLRDSREFDSESHLSALESFGLFDTSLYGPLDAAENWLGSSNVASVGTVGLILLTISAVTLIAVVSGRIGLTKPAKYAVGFASLCAMVVFTLVYLGGPLLALAYEVPGLGDGNLGRTRFLLSFAFSVIAAVGIDALLSDDSVVRVQPRKALRVVSGGLLALLALTFAWYLPSFLSKLTEREDSLDFARPMIRSLTIGVIATAIVIALGYAYRAKKVERAWAVGVVIALVWLQLALPMRSFTPQAPIEDFYPRLEVHDLLAELTEGRYRYSSTGANFYPSSSQLYDIADLRGTAVHPERFVSIVRAAAPNAFARDAIKILMPIKEWRLTSPAHDVLALRYFALPTSAVPLGMVTQEEAPVDEWVEVERHQFALIPQTDLAGITIALSAIDCQEGDVTVTLRDGDNIVDSASRPAFAIKQGGYGFALVGTGRIDEPSITVVAPDDCEMKIGLGKDATPSHSLIVDDRYDSVEIVATESSWIYERATARPIVGAYTDWTVTPERRAIDTIARTPAGTTPTPVISAVDDGEAPPRPTDPAGEAQVANLEFGDDVVAFNTSSNGDAIAIVAQNWSDGWSATIDGVATDIYLADGWSMGVQIPAGDHELRFSYRPPGLTVSLAISGLGVVGLVAAMLWTWRRKPTAEHALDK